LTAVGIEITIISCDARTRRRCDRTDKREEQDENQDAFSFH
jgi:hypothetical protein